MLGIRDCVYSNHFCRSLPPFRLWNSKGLIPSLLQMSPDDPSVVVPIMFTSLSRQGTNKFPYILHPSSTHPSSIQLANLQVHQHGAWNMMVPQRRRYDQLWEEKHGWQAQKWENKNRANILQHGVPNMDLQTNKGQYRVTGPQKKALLQIDRRPDYTRISLSIFYHPWHPGPLHIIILSSHDLSIYFFTIPGIQGLYISSSWVPIISLSIFYHPWHPGPLHVIILSSHNISTVSIFTIPGIQGLYISSSLVPIISLSIFLPSLASRAFTYHHPEFP